MGSEEDGVKAEREGRLQGSGSKPVSAEQREVARVKMERDLLRKASAYFAKERQ